MNRKQFLIGSSLTAISLVTVGFIIKRSDGSYAGDCETTNDILGPKYRPGAPIRSDLTFNGLEGERIIVKGKVFTDDCKTVIPNATVECWHCNSKGEYDDHSKDFLHRAKWINNENGEYSFLTIVPGRYLNVREFRPSHYHFRVTAKDHRELISQIYFAGDPHIAKDPWASKPKAKERILTLNPKTSREEASVLFNIYLERV